MTIVEAPGSPVAQEAPIEASYDERLIAASGLLEREKTPWLGFLQSPQFRYGLLGFAIFFLVWYATTALFPLPRFQFIPNPLDLFREWTSRDPQFGVSIFTSVYYEDILVSVLRVYAAFTVAILLGVPLGILLGWNRVFYRMVFPIVALLRPVPPLAWVPLAVLMFYGTELPVIFVTLLAAFFATTLNTLLGVQSIDRAFFRAAACLGYGRWDVLVRVAIPGALPHIFTGLQV